ncbi:MAG: hypothetical protein U0637_09885 [Phycisphaerales bacterium]
MQARQDQPQSSPLTTLLLICLFAAAIFFFPACSVYHAAQAQLPPDSSDRIALRMREATNAALDLDQQLASAADPGILESYAWELTRRVASVRDTPDSPPQVRQALAAMLRGASLAEQIPRNLPDNSASLTSEARASLAAALATLARTTPDADHRLTTLNAARLPTP